MNELINDFLKQKCFAVAGSFRHENKIAYKIFKALIARGYTVYPVNPNYHALDGFPCYPSVLDIPTKVDVINIVTPPQVTERILRECLTKSIRRVWLQPGADNAATLQFCRDHDMNVVHGVCIMMESL